MTDYSKISDEDINSMVIIELIKAGKLTDDHEDVSGKPYTSDGWNWGPGVKTNLFKDGKPFVTHHNGSRLDYCNNPADAWPIIVGNLISVEPDYEFIDPSEEQVFASGAWISEHYDGRDGLIQHVDISPLRAAMIVFLMMQEKSK